MRRMVGMVWEASSPPVLVCSRAGRVPQFFVSSVTHSPYRRSCSQQGLKAGPSQTNPPKVQPVCHPSKPALTAGMTKHGISTSTFGRRQSAVGSDKLKQRSWFLHDRPIPTERRALFQCHQLSLSPCLARAPPPCCAHPQRYAAANPTYIHVHGCIGPARSCTSQLLHIHIQMLSDNLESYN